MINPVKRLPFKYIFFKFNSFADNNNPFGIEPESIFPAKFNVIKSFIFSNPFGIEPINEFDANEIYWQICNNCIVIGIVPDI